MPVFINKSSVMSNGGSIFIGQYNIDNTIYAILDPTNDHGYIYGPVVIDWNGEAYYAILSNNNLTATMLSPQQGTARSTIPLIGKKYFEVYCNAAFAPMIGIINEQRFPNVCPNGECYVWANNGNTWHAGTPNVFAGYSTYTTGDTISVLYDSVNQTISWWKNGVDINGGPQYTGITGSTYYAVINSQYNVDVFTVNFGASGFTYQPPSGYTGIYEKDIDALAFVNSAGIANPTQIKAIGNLVANAKNNGWWYKCTAIYPFIGANATSHKFNLKNPLDLDSSYRIDWQGGWVHSTRGPYGSGYNGGSYGNTFIIPATAMTPYSTHLSVYVTAQGAASAFGTCGYLGESGGGGSRFDIELCNGNWTSAMYFQNVAFSPYGDANIGGVAIESGGFYLSSRDSTTNATAYRNCIAAEGISGGAHASPYSGTVNNFNDLTDEFYIGAAKGDMSYADMRSYGFWTIGNQIDYNTSLKMYKDILNFNIAIDRTAATIPNPYDTSAVVFADGSNQINAYNNGFSGICRTVLHKNSDAWCSEFTTGNDINSSFYIGIATSAATLTSTLGGDANGWGFHLTGFKYNNGIASAYGSDCTTAGTVISCAHNIDTGAITFYKNGISMGLAFSGVTGGTYYMSIGADGTASGIITANFGATPSTIKYPISGYNKGFYS